jgi:UDP-N-acetylglucosamine 2-epimerase (non-hydrolysing)
MQRSGICFIIGAESEALRSAPVINALRRDTRFTVNVIVSGVEPKSVEETLSAFGIIPEITLELPPQPSSNIAFTARAMSSLESTITGLRPAACVVQGESTIASIAALCAFWQQIPLVHLEAGLRIGSLADSFPDEGNRKIIDHISQLHLAPTSGAAMNLVREGLTSDTIVVTGNTSVDAIHELASGDLHYCDPRLTEIEDSGHRIVILDIQRPDIRGKALHRVLDAMRQLIVSDPTVHVVIPADTEVRRALRVGCSGSDRIFVCEPLPHADRARLLANASLVLSDSNGLQEEAPSFDVPVLILRDVTERPESVSTGVARLVGTETSSILREATDVLAGVAKWNTTGYGTNSFGDGRASTRCVEAIGWLLRMNERPEAFQPETANAVLARPLLYRVA